MTGLWVMGTEQARKSPGDREWTTARGFSLWLWGCWGPDPLLSMFATGFVKPFKLIK